MRVFLVSLGYIYESDVEKKKAKIIKRDWQLREMGVIVNVTNEEDPFSGDSSNVIVSGDQLLSMWAAKLEFTVQHETTIGADNLENTLERLNEVLDKLKGAPRVADQMRDFNEKVEVHMPGNGMLQFNSTMLLEDSCTDALQDCLNNGWRVICACPQPNQRRPDYILGKYDPSIIVNGPSASRGKL